MWMRPERRCEPSVLGLVDDPHATTTQLFNHAVVGDGLAEYWSGIVHLRRMLGRATLQVNRGGLHAGARNPAESRFPITIYFWLRR